MADKSPKAVVIGVGAREGLGAGLAIRFAAAGHHVLLAGRTPEKIDHVAAVIAKNGGRATPVPTDTTREADITRLFDLAMAEDATSGPADLIVYNAGNNMRTPLRDMSAELFETFWRTNCFGGFLVARETARRLVPLGRGTLIFTGATGSLRSAAGFAHFAASKAGLRALAQSAAREFGPLGLHIAHVIIDGGINGERLRSRFPERFEELGDAGFLSIPAIAETYWQIHRQHPSAWTHEVDLRPFKEPF